MLLQKIYKDFPCMTKILCCSKLVDNRAIALKSRQNVGLEE